MKDHAMNSESSNDREVAPNAGSPGIVATARYLLHWRIVAPALWFLRRRRNAFQGNYSDATIPLRWPSSPLRTDLIDEIVKRNGVQSYLEIGCRDDECFAQVDVPFRVGVDPVSGGTVRATSDEFFAANRDRFDLVFIDGLHLYEQVVADIRNSLAVLNPGGVILLHDCLPTDCVMQYREQASIFWNGDVWKAIVEARTWQDIDTATCLIDQGVGIIRPRPNGAPLEAPPGPFVDLKYDFLAADYARLLRTVDYESGIAFACGDGRS